MLGLCILVLAAVANCTEGEVGLDECDSDGNKTVPGMCGCGVADTNTDGDFLPDCTDQCPSDPTRISAGPCGCADCTATPLVGT